MPRLTIEKRQIAVRLRREGHGYGSIANVLRMQYGETVTKGSEKVMPGKSA
jgi:hypothetical protein